jgi:excisionase family DNA binding protein
MKRKSKPYANRLVFTVFETAAALAVTPATVRKAIKSGDLGAITIHGRYRVPIEKLNAFVLRSSTNQENCCFDMSRIPLF